jgi:hypothetical protein
VLHCEDDAYSLCKAFHPAPHLLDMNGSHIDDLLKAYREDNWDFIKGEYNYEIGHFMADYAGSIVDLYGLKAMFFARGFVGRLYISQYHDEQAPQTRCERLGLTPPDSIPFTPETLHDAGFTLEQSDWEILPYRAGGPSCAKRRHTVWRHKSVAAPVPLFLVDNTTWPVAPATRDIARRGQELNVPERKSAAKPERALEQVDPVTGYRRPVWA